MLTLFQIHFPRNISYMLSGIHEREKKKKGIITLQTAFLLFLIFKMVLWNCVLHGLMLKGVQIPRSFSNSCDAMYIIYSNFNKWTGEDEGGREGGLWNEEEGEGCERKKGEKRRGRWGSGWMDANKVAYRNSQLCGQHCFKL